MALIEPVPFHFEIDWSERFTEEREHETTIQAMWDDTEQRSNLSEVPNRRFSYLIKCLEIEHDELQRLQARLWGGQHLQWWVPYWPRERFLVANAIAGATSLSVASTARMQLVVGQGVLLYRDPSRFEVVEVVSVAASSIGVAATTLAWQGVGRRDKVIPCFRAFLAPESEYITQDVHLGSARVTFDLDITDD
jgi:hypothetical protein